MFEGDGFAVLRRFIGEDELGALRAAVDRSLAKPLPPGCERPHNTLAPLRFNDPIVTALLESPRRQAAINQATSADDLRWISAYISVKEAGSAALWWHQDWWCWNHPVSYRAEASQVAVLCYLADTTAANGALRVIPGSHLRSTPLHAALPEAHTHAAGGLDRDHLAMRDHPDQLTLEVRAGDAVVTDYRLLHGTHANSTGDRRDCVLLSFTPSWGRLPPDLRAHLIRHPALPTAEERNGSGLWPDFDGTPRDLALSRVAPSQFVTTA